ncbi:MAG: type I glutamate--ammonia ligase [Bacteroidetes bacterium]|nr:MAG: type I glutamate--ammonia ligase [Bacteroidota bacterium]
MAKSDKVKETTEKLKKDNVGFVNLQFSDIMGMAKSVTIPTGKFKDAMVDGLWFDGSSIEGFTRIYESDMLLQPDLDTYSVVPWLNHNGTNIARVICDVYTPDGKPYECDPRYILRKTLKEAEKMGYDFNTGPELEFFLFKMENGTIKTSTDKKIEPHDRGKYFDLVLDLGFDVRRDMMTALQMMGIEVEASHHEVAPGQHEIDFKYGNALTTADRVMTMKSLIKTVAQKHGLIATFMPKPITGVNGNGMHVHQSLFSLDGKTNLFFDAKDKYKLSKIAYQYLAGQMHHVKSMCAILNPLVNSYKRLVPGYEASTYICWAQINRSALVRVPRYSPGKDKATRLEIRCPDPSTNPYLAFAVLLKAGLDGIKNKMTPPGPVEEDVFEFDMAELEKHNIEVLPYSLWHATRALQKSELMMNVLGKDMMKKYVRAKTEEWDDFRIRVTDWEVERYLES